MAGYGEEHILKDPQALYRMANINPLLFPSISRRIVDTGKQKGVNSSDGQLLLNAFESDSEALKAIEHMQGQVRTERNAEMIGRNEIHFKL